MTTTITMPSAEAARLEEAYRDARVILEYGSGGSTEAASQMADKYVMSVENDADWARKLRSRIATKGPRSAVIVQTIDLGPTGDWGRLINDHKWRKFHLYSNAVWDAPYFRHPDIVLIDGRFRLACFMTVLLRAERPLVVLFDDYVSRPKYHLVERIVAPTRIIGRMAEFAITPGMISPQHVGFVIAQFFDVTLHGHVRNAYDLTTDATKPDRPITKDAEQHDHAKT